MVDKVDTELFDEDKYILSVGTGDEWEFLTVNFYDIDSADLEDLEEGDKVTVVGEFDDGGDLGVTIRNAHMKG